MFIKDQNTFYIYDENHKVKEIRTRITNRSLPLFVIQKPIQKENKIQYKVEIVSEQKFYENLM
jgi:hypothetical protein